MKLNQASILWSVKHLFKESDNDLFPRPYELSIINEFSNQVISACKEIDITNYKWKASRRFVVPKDDYSFRNATQLDILDSILIAAIIREYGHLIEAKRIAERAEIVFSYRFKPLSDGTLYSNNNAWESFWESCRKSVAQFNSVVMCDISDFYNQISLHTIENQLEICGFPAPITKKIKDLIIHLTARASKGIPIGPHISHLLAEMSLIPFDNQLQLRDIKFKRYVDDIVIFCDDAKDAKIKLNLIADILDKEQRLILQKSKTRILDKREFEEICNQNLLEDIAYNEEEQIVKIIKRHSGGSAYTKVKLSELSDDEIAELSEENIIELFKKYLNLSSPNYEKLKWLYRRLSQLGIPHAVDFSLQNFELLIPALNDVCLYINSCAENYSSDWRDVGKEIIDILKDRIISSNQFYSIALYNLFVYNGSLNHFSILIKNFESAPENIKRKIFLASMNYDSEGWLRGFKEHYPKFDSWTKRSFLIAASKLPEEEREFFYRGVKASLLQYDILERIIIDWGNEQ